MTFLDLYYLVHLSAYHVLNCNPLLVSLLSLPDVMYRTPSKMTTSRRDSTSPLNLTENLIDRAGPLTDVPSIPVRRSIGEIEARIRIPTPPPQREEDGHKKPPRSKTAEAKQVLLKAKHNINMSRNLKTDIKNAIMEAVEKLYTLVKEAEESTKSYATENRQKLTVANQTKGKTDKEIELLQKIEEHGRLLKENKMEMVRLQESITNLIDTAEKTNKEGITYADITARTTKVKQGLGATMHSVMITSKNETETGDQVIQRISKTINAKEEGLMIEKIRKGKDRKIILGCRTKQEIEKIKTKIEATGELRVENIKNKDPLVILYGVLKINTDDDIIKAIRTQNKYILSDITNENDRMTVKYKKKTRNPHTNHVVLQVSPPIWNRLIQARFLHIDLQKVRVADQSPLNQCSRCLGYGHGKSFCPEPTDLPAVCSHCGGSHTKMACDKWKDGTMPSCVNCTKAQLEKSDHNAFDVDCPVRKKFDSLARTAVAYC